MPNKPTKEQIKTACQAWWDADWCGKRIATIPWNEIPETWKDHYRLRMAQALIALPETKT